MNNEMLKYKIKKYSIKEIEEESLSEIAAHNSKYGYDRVPNIPFGRINRRWNEFKSQIVDTDELWFAEHQVGFLDGWGGYILVRKDPDGNEYIVDHITTWVS